MKATIEIERQGMVVYYGDFKKDEIRTPNFIIQDYESKITPFKKYKNWGAGNNFDFEVIRHRYELREGESVAITESGLNMKFLPDGTIKADRVFLTQESYLSEA